MGLLAPCTALPVVTTSRDLNVDLKSRGEWRRQIDASTKTPAGVRTPSTVMTLHAIPLSWSPDKSFTSSKVYTGMESIQHPSPLQTMLGIARPSIFNKNNTHRHVDCGNGNDKRRVHFQRLAS